MTAMRRIVAFPFHDWRKCQAEGFRTRDGHLLQAFARRQDVERILVVDRPSSAAERLLRHHAARAAGEVIEEWRAGRSRITVTAVSPKVETVDIEVPDVIGPLRRGRGWWFDTFGQELVQHAVSKAVEHRLGAASDSIAWMPTVAPVLFQPGARVAFDSLDNWLIHPVLRNHAVDAGAGYATILPRAEAVFASGPASVKVLARWREGVQLLPNGVDAEFFSGDVDGPSDLPSGPIVGYAGKLADRIDDALVVETAERLPKAAFVFVGPVMNRSAVRRMKGLPNVHLLGDRPYDQMPAYLRAFDVAWIPHRVGEGETGGDPIKLYEYWAAGRQVVSTRIDGSEAWAGQAFLADGAADAAEAIRGLLEGRLRPKPTEIPVGRTWDEIAAVLLGVEVNAPAPPPGSSGAGS